MKVSCSIDINSTPETVFCWLARPEKAMVWMTSVSKTEILHETPNMTGTTFREIVEEDGKGIEMQGIITGYEPNKSIAFHLNSQVNVVDVEYSIVGVPTGVSLTQIANIHWKFPMNIISMMIGSKLMQNIVAQSQKELNQLKELSEGRKKPIGV